MAQMQKVSWRTVGYAALATTAIIAAAVAIVHSDGVRPTLLKSAAATRWLVYQPTHKLVLADGLSGHVVATIDAKSSAAAADELAVQGAGGAFLVAPSQGSVRAISTASLQLGTPQAVASLSDATSPSSLGVGANGLTVVNTTTSLASIVPAADVTRQFTIPKAKTAMVARDGSMWLFSASDAKHVMVDGSSRKFALRGPLSRPATTVGSHAVFLDLKNQTLHWLEGGDVAVGSLPNLADAVVQIKGDDAPCVWLGSGDTLACVGRTEINRTVVVTGGLSIGAGDKLAVAGDVAVVVSPDNRVQRIDLDNHTLLTTGGVENVRQGAQLAITAVNGLIWIDDVPGDSAWVIHDFGVAPIHKNDFNAPSFDAQGQVQDNGAGNGQATPGAGNVPGSDTESNHLDHNNVDDPPVANDDSVTARAGTTITIPVTGNDWDPDGNAIAVISVGDRTKAAHGVADVLDATSVSYKPAAGYSGTDSFDYTIEDEHGNPAHATVHIQLLAPDSPNRPPIATPDHVKTRLNRPVTIDVLKNDIDPERDVLSVPTFTEYGAATITDTKGPTGLPALRYQPPGAAGVYTFKYQAADPQGGVSEKTKVTVDVLADNLPNQPPTANPDSVRMQVGKPTPLNVRANDVDPDGDDLFISDPKAPRGVVATIVSQQLEITLLPGAEKLSAITYRLSDGTAAHDQIGHVLAVRLDDSAPNRPPVANPDTERVVVGNQVKIPVTANDLDPEGDSITLLHVDQPAGGVGTTAVEGNFVRFTPNLPNITKATPVSFDYKIGDGKGNVAFGTVTVTVLAEALPSAPFARDDFADTFIDKPVNIDVLVNDSDPSGGTPHLSEQPVCPNGGDATVTADERINFVPPLGLPGTFRCQYKVSNSQGRNAEAWIIVTVTAAPPGNHPPVMNNDLQPRSVPVGGSITIAASDLATDIDGDPVMFSSVSKPLIGGSTNFTQKAATFTYTAPASTSASDTPTVASFEVTISDGHNDGNVPGTVSVKIIPVPPVAVQPGTHDIVRTMVLGDVPVSIDVVAALRDDNNGADVTLLQAVPDSGSSAAVDVKGGTVTINPTASGVVFVTYTVKNAGGLSATGKIKLTVTDPPVINLPPIAVADELDVASGGSGTVNLIGNDLGIYDTGDKPTAQLIDRPPKSFGTLQLTNGILQLDATPGGSGSATVHYLLSDGSGATSTGSVVLNIATCAQSPPKAVSTTVFTGYMQPINIDLGVYAQSGQIVDSSISGAGLTGPTGTYTPPAGMNGSVTVTFNVENGCHQTDPGTLTIDVNRAPVAGSIDRNVSPGGAAVTLLASDLASDPDGEPLTIASIADNPAWVSLGSSANGPMITASAPSGTASGTYTLHATVQDPGGLTAVATVNLIISNQPPTAVADAYYTELSLLTFDPTANDFDTEPGPLNVQTVAVVDGPATVVSINSPWVTVSLGHGVSDFNYTIVDRGGLTSSSTISITSNHSPTVPDISDTTNQPTIDLYLDPSDPDGDALTVMCDAQPDLFTVEITNDPDTGSPPEPGRVKLHITVLNNFQGTAIFNCTATDPYGAKGSAQVSLTITP
jgi:hypothetical protein